MNERRKDEEKRIKDQIKDEQKRKGLMKARRIIKGEIINKRRKNLKERERI